MIRGGIYRQFFRSGIGIVLILATVAIVCWALIAALRPLPARNFSLATGPADSAYARAGERYREILARDGVRLTLVASNGAVDNARLLQDPRSGVSAAFVQSGAIDAAHSRGLESLGTVFYEAVWLFCRCPGDRLFQERPAGLRVSVGPVGSAGRPLALKLLELNGIDVRRHQIFAYGTEEAEQALLADRLDAAVVLAAWDASPAVRRLARAPGIELHKFIRADAYVALVPWLTKLTLPRGVADLANDRPAEDTTLLASKASLAIRDDMHPALQYLLLRAAMEDHGHAEMFQRAGEFPAAEQIDLPLSEEALHTYRAGPSFLQRTLPFWLAVLVQRMLLFIVPVVGLVYPMWSLAPRMYRWVQQRQINHLYRDLNQLDRELRAQRPRANLVERLDEIERHAIELRVRLGFGEATYNLKTHIRLLRDRLRANP